ncbi:putative phycocyanin operon protein Z [Porphyridium purpureum]|uniref:Putative phycocyanin operon protein Z n=1 Tax=Porphyridium purpureum TaxID=35688 RepID=A0A5J4YIQ2_PORPP|nr:putative phycocyanin operon protein Z [Porphyridium purpureum]|eukprot:POR4065..scf297_16
MSAATKGGDPREGSGSGLVANSGEMFVRRAQQFRARGTTRPARGTRRAGCRRADLSSAVLHMQQQSPLGLSNEETRIPDDELPKYRKADGLTDADWDKMFARLGHEARTQRQIATMTLAANMRPDTVPRLIEMLRLEDTVPRRQAVQTLGAIGKPCVDAVCDELISTQDVTVRASCVKSLAALILNYPELRLEFPQRALDTLKSVVHESDQVTKLATVMCLGVLGSRDVTRDIPGSPAAIDLLLDILSVTQDVGLGASVVMSLGSIGTCGDADRVLDGLRGAVESMKDIEGGDYIAQLAEAQIEKLSSSSLADSVSKIN